jgi:hypothetical protein
MGLRVDHAPIPHAVDAIGATTAAAALGLRAFGASGQHALGGAVVGAPTANSAHRASTSIARAAASRGRSSSAADRAGACI